MHTPRYPRCQSSCRVLPSITPKSYLMPLPSKFFMQLLFRFFSCHRLSFPVLELRITGITHTTQTLSCEGPSTQHVFDIHLFVPCISSSFIVLAEEYSFAWMYHSLPILLLVDTKSVSNSELMGYICCDQSCKKCFDKHTFSFLLSDYSIRITE